MKKAGKVPTFIFPKQYDMQPNFEKYLLEITHSKSYQETETIQSLWSGYGKIARYALTGGLEKQVVIKHIDLRQADAHPRGWNTNRSHLRKVKSYQVETSWYSCYADRCNTSCKIPRLIGSYKEGQEQWIILEDLNQQFPKRLNTVHLEQIKACLNWLAHFHAEFLGEEPKELWSVGTYWHLATRPDELDEMEDGLLKSKAAQIDQLLNQCTYKTLVHGDAKLANFCFSEDGSKVAAVDFQYIGQGCGIKDVMYFLSSCLSGKECTALEEELLDYYFSTLKTASQEQLEASEFQELETEWRRLYCFAWADFVRFLLGWMPTHYKLHHYSLGQVDKVLKLL